MSSSLNRIKKNIIEAMQSANKQGTSAYDSVAEVRRVEGDTAWVHIAGGVDETPVKLTIAAKAGDTVQVRVGGGRAWITGNASAPPTDDKTAKLAKLLASIAGNRAKTAQKIANQAQIVADSALKGTKENTAQMAQMVIDFNGDIENLQDQIDGNITTWFYDVDPAMDLPPAVDWDTDEKKNTHLGDIYYNTVKGYAWRFMKSGSTYSWERITDTDVTKALADAAKAKDTADSKRRVFYNIPTVPYDAGDLWVQGSDGDILRCAQAKTSAGSYDRNDWILASKYTDDSALNTWIERDFATIIQGLEEGLADAKIETYYQATDPSTGWSDTQKSEHEGDLWYNNTASVQKCYRWTGTVWQELTATPPQAVFDSIDNKATIYTGTTTPTSPSSGDLWFKGVNEPILTYVNGSWVEYNKYTAAAEDAAKSATDYISPQSTLSTDDGIKVFPKSEKDNPQNYSQINQQGMQIYKGGQRTASFGSEKISLGENSEQSVLEMCGGLASLSSEVTTDIAGDKLGYILLAPTEFAQSKDYPFRVGIASGKRDSSIYLGDAECEMSAYLTPRAASINYIQSAISGSSQFDLNEEYPEDGPHAYTGIGMYAGMGLTDGSEPAAGIDISAWLENSKILNSLDLFGDQIVINGEPLADFVIKRGTSGIWTYEKWYSGKAVCYTLSVVKYTGLSMSASGYSYVSGVVSQSLPSKLFIDANYNCNAQEQTDGRLAKVVRLPESTASTFKFKIHSSSSGTNTANIRFDIKGRWR